MVLVPVIVEPRCLVARDSLDGLYADFECIIPANAQWQSTVGVEELDVE